MYRRKADRLTVFTHALFLDCILVTTEAARVCSPACDVEHDEPERANELACLVCEEPFRASRRDAVFCSNACRQMAYRLRKAEGLQVIRDSAFAASRGG